MKTIALFLVSSVLTSIGVAQTTQRHSFNPSHLSEAGQKAYQILLETESFALGGQETREEPALHTLLREESAAEALMGLVEQAGPEGGLYALLGLRQLDAEAFKWGAKRYKSKEELPFRIIHDGMKVRRGIVSTSIPNGCISIWEERLEVLSSIESGRYDKLLKRAPND
jgi:hypothetical protein